MKNALVFASLCAVTMLFACGPRGTSEALVHKSHAAQQGVALRSALDVRVGDDVRFDLAVTNDGARKAELDFPSGQTHDIVVTDAAGRTVWRWSDGRLFTQGMQNKVVRTADTLHFAEAWTPQSPGRYVAIATVASANYPLSQRAEFIVP